jgi:RNA polymerase sigma-70 factor (ECF subfamily)
MEGREEAMADVAVKGIAPAPATPPSGADALPTGTRVLDGRVRVVRAPTASTSAVTGRSIRESLRSAYDSALVESFLAGEYRAFEEIVSRYHVRLINFVYRTIGDREKAEDLVQEVFIRVYRHLHRFDRGKKFSTWVYTIASNLAKNELRNRSRNPLVLFQAIKRNWDDEDRPLQFEDSASRPDDLFRKRHLREAVEAAVARLPEHHRQVFVLRELEGKSYEEIAEITGCNLGTVKSRLNRARTSFADIIAPALK